MYIINRLGLVSILLVAGYLTGCASPSTPEAMMVTDFQASRAIGDSVAVAVGGGKETSSMGASQISDAAFQEAISQSILSSGIFKQVIAGEGGEYLLSVSIVSMDQPIIGFSFTVKMETAWRLTEKNSGKVVWEQVINSEHTATTGDAFAGTKRLRLANEGAARNGIRQALTSLSDTAL